MSIFHRFLLRTWRLAAFFGYFGYEFLRSNAVVAWEILTPGSRLKPAVIEIPLRCRTRFEIVSLTALVTLTPGTLALAVKEDPPTLFVHGMHVFAVEHFHGQISMLEGRMLAAVRPVTGRGARVDDSTDGR